MHLTHSQPLLRQLHICKQNLKGKKITYSFKWKTKLMTFKASSRLFLKSSQKYVTHKSIQRSVLDKSAYKRFFHIHQCTFIVILQATFLVINFYFCFSFLLQINNNTQPSRKHDQRPTLGIGIYPGDELEVIKYWTNVATKSSKYREVYLKKMNKGKNQELGTVGRGGEAAKKTRMCI